MKDQIFELQTKIWRHDQSRCYTHNLSSCEIKAWKNIQAWTGPIYLCDTNEYMKDHIFELLKLCIAAMINHVFIHIFLRSSNI